jgi:hypothetical protein
MKRGCLLSIAVVVLGIGILVAGYWYKYPNYTYRYRLTVNIEVGGKLYSGSSVIEVTWHGGPEIGDVGPYSPTMRGQGALVDLEDRGVVVATLGPNWESRRYATGRGALWLVPYAFGDEKGGDHAMLPTLRGKRQLRFDNLPHFLWFSNAQDPTSAKMLVVDDIPHLFGPTARFAGAFVEITNDPLVIDIREKLPWLNALEASRSDKNTIYLPDGLAISRYTFIEGPIVNLH